MEQLVNRFGEETIRSLSPEEGAAVVFTEQHCWVTNGDFQGMLTLHRADITSLLKGLMNKGLLEKDGDRRGTSYHLPSSPPKEVSSASKEVSSASKEVSSASKGVSSASKGVSSASMGVGSSTKEVGSESTEIETDAVHATSMVERKTRRQKSETYRLVLMFCAHEFKTVSMIAAHLNLKDKYLRDKVIPALLHGGQLIQKFPDTPNHPHQAYRTSSDD